MIRRLLELVKFSHTIFAIPFAAVAALWLMTPDTPWTDFVWLALAMVSARTAAMAFNRLVDRHIDRANPRTATRELPSGKLSVTSVVLLTVVSLVVLVVSAWLLDPLAAMLSPVLVVVLLGYSWTKRFTWLCHLVLGIGIGLAPMGVQIGLQGDAGWLVVLLGLGIALWIAGFDILYALLDIDFDRANGIRSVPARFGPRAALWISRVLHLGAVVALALAGQLAPGPPWPWWVASAIVAGILIWEQVMASSLRPQDLNRAFFNANSWVSVVMLAGGVAVVLLA